MILILRISFTKLQNSKKNSKNKNVSEYGPRYVLYLQCTTLNVVNRTLFQKKKLMFKSFKSNRGLSMKFRVILLHEFWSVKKYN